MLYYINNNYTTCATYRLYLIYYNIVTFAFIRHLTRQLLRLLHQYLVTLDELCAFLNRGSHDPSCADYNYFHNNVFVSC